MYMFVHVSMYTCMYTLASAYKLEERKAWCSDSGLCDGKERIVKKLSS